MSAPVASITLSSLQECKVSIESVCRKDSHFSSVDPRKATKTSKACPPGAAGKCTCCRAFLSTTKSDKVRPLKIAAHPLSSMLVRSKRTCCPSPFSESILHMNGWLYPDRRKIVAC